jgi:hypothetical protein
LERTISDPLLKGFKEAATETDNGLPPAKQTNEWKRIIRFYPLIRFAQQSVVG